MPEHLKIDEFFKIIRKEDQTSADRMYRYLEAEGFFENIDGPPRRPFLTLSPLIDYMLHANRRGMDRVLSRLRKQGYQLGIMKCNPCAKRLEDKQATMHSALFYTLEAGTTPFHLCPYCGGACVWHLKLNPASK